MSRHSVPMVLEQYCASMLDEKTPANIRFNYRTTVENIRDYCDRALEVYDREQNKVKRKQR